MSEYHYIKAAIYAILKNEKGEVLFMRRKNTGYMDDKLGFPSGHVEQGESFNDALIRELEEEACVRTKTSSIRFATMIHRYQPSGIHDYVDVFFYVDEWDGDVKIGEPNKASEIVWAHPESVAGETIDYYQNVFELLKNEAVLLEIPRKDDE